MVFVSASPRLIEDKKPGKLYECPVGKLLREASWTFGVSSEARILFEAPDVFGLTNQPEWYRQAVAVCQNEYATQAEQESQERKAQRDAKFGARVRKAR